MRKQKFKSAEEKRRYEENQRSWEQLCAKYKPNKNVKATNTRLVYSLDNPPGRDRLELPSRDTGLGIATAPNPLKYTGDKIIGVAMMHKSNLVPVFTDDQAKDLASMRR